MDARSATAAATLASLDDTHDEAGASSATTASVSAHTAAALDGGASVDDDLVRLMEGVKLADAPRPSVALVYEPSMQAHAPALEQNVFELPQRIVAIESVLRGHAFDAHSAAVPSVQSAKVKTREWGESSPLRTGLRESTVNKKASKLSVQPLSDLFDASKGVAGLTLELEEGWKPTEQSDALPGSLWSRCAIVRAPLAPLEWLQIVHDDAHLRNIVRKTLIARLGGVTFVDKECKDLYFSPGTLHAARYAAGGAVAAVQALFEGTTAVRSPLQASFAIVRPPGHHCSSSTPSGFCFLSNTAIAAQYARRILGLSRVAIVDTGEGVTIIAALLLVHELTHMQTIIQACDGTQQIFYEDPSVLTISCHVAARVREPSAIDDVGVAVTGTRVVWPFSASKGVAFTGAGAATGTNINVPWPHEYVDEADYEEAMRTIVVPALRSFKPQLILWACGFDAAAGDTLAGTKLSTDGYWRIGRHLMRAVPDVPVATVLEGGYNPERIALAAENVVRALLGFASPSHRVPAQGDASDAPPRQHGEPLVEPWQPDSVHALAPELRGFHAAMPRPDPSLAAAPSSARCTPMGVAWRSQAPGVVRPEAIMEAVRRLLGRVPRWHGVFAAADLEDGHEMSVEHEAAVLEQLLEQAAQNAPPLH